MPSTNPPAVVDTETFQVTRTLHIAAPTDRVWAALTREDLVAQWFGTTASLPDLRVGGTGSVGWADYGEVPLRIDEYDEPTVFAFTWGAPGQPLQPDNSTQVRFTLVADGDATVLSVVESGFERLTKDTVAAMEDNRGGWTSELDELVALVEAPA